MRHPLGPAIVLQLAFLTFANGDVLGNDFGGGRAVLPLIGLGTIAFFAPGTNAASEAEAEAAAVTPAG
jgi:hypothetical protein